MAKRLRGWKLEYESGIQPKAKASTALEKAKDCETESVLANKLLFLWARGQLSATLIRELADCALADEQTIEIWLPLPKLEIGAGNQAMCTSRSCLSSVLQSILHPVLMYGFPAPILKQTRMLWKRHQFFCPT